MSISANPYSVFIGMLALIGIPPLSGFFAKLFVFRTTANASILGGWGVVLALLVALGGSIFTIAYVTRAWNRGFWGTQSEAVRTAIYQPVLVTVVTGLAALLLIAGIGFEPVLRAVEAALAREEYVNTVFSGVREGR